MTCEVEHLRMTDGHGWTHKGDVADKDYYIEKKAEKLAKVITEPVKLLGQIAYECYLEHRSFYKVCMVLNIADRTARNRVGQWANKHNLVVPKSIGDVKCRQIDFNANFAKVIYDEYMLGKTSLVLSVKYRKTETAIKGIIARYIKKHNMPKKRGCKKNKVDV